MRNDREKITSKEEQEKKLRKYITENKRKGYFRE